MRERLMPPARLVFEMGLRVADEDYPGMGHNLSEYYAYEWQFKTAILLDYSLGNVITQFNKYKVLTKDIRI